MDHDAAVRSEVYRFLVEATRAPTVPEVGGALGLGQAEVREAYQRLFIRRVLVLGEDGETILMAPPFSAVPTQHRVRVGSREYFANCAWDALGIPAALHAPAIVTSRCEQSYEPLTIRVEGNGPEAVACVAHFAVPAARWWEDIVFT
ncbi:MAG TPA: organomercurial lyase [Gemmatimonadales bacterium]|jgi:hypothetical protein